MKDKDRTYNEQPSNEHNEEKKGQERIYTTSDWIDQVRDGVYVKYTEPIIDEDTVKEEKTLEEDSHALHIDDEAYKTIAERKLENWGTDTKRGLVKAFIWMLLLLLLDYCDVYTTKGERQHIAKLPVIERNDSTFNPRAVTLEKIRPKRDVIKITLRNNTDTVLASLDARIYFYGKRQSYYQTFNTRKGRYMYDVIKPHKTKTFKIPKTDVSGNSKYKVKFVLQGYAKYEGYSQIYNYPNTP